MVNKMKGGNMNKIFILLIGFIFLISMVNAYEPHKQNTDLDLTISSNNATSCNVTYIQYPEGSKSMLNLALTKDGTSFYKVIEHGNFSQIGNTCLGLACTDGITYETGSVCREVTPTGFLNTLGFYIIILLVFSGMIVLGYVSQEEWFILLAGMGLLMLGIYTINYGIAGQKDMFMTWGMGIIEIGLGAFLTIRAGFSKIED